MIYAGILAGGIGIRMNQRDLPKQFMSIGEKPIIVHTLDQFLINSDIHEIIVAVPEMWMSYTVDLIEKHYGSETDCHIKVIAGGFNRTDTLMCIINHIECQHGLSNDDFIISHDANRPFVTQKMIDESIEKVKVDGAVYTAIHTYDMIIESQDHKFLNNLPDKDHLYQGQTPQSFHIETLKKYYVALSKQEKASLKDTATIFMRNNHNISIVQGDYSNIKITTTYDLKVARWLIKDGLL